MRGKVSYWLLAVSVISMSLPGTGFAAGDAVAAYKADLVETCRGIDGGKLTFQPGFETRRDVTGDRKADVILDNSKAACSSAASTFCGSGGCEIAVFVTSKRGFRNAFQPLTQDWQIVSLRGKPAIHLFLHGTACGRSGAEACEKWYAWKNGAFKAVKTR